MDRDSQSVSREVTGWKKTKIIGLLLTVKRFALFTVINMLETSQIAQHHLLTVM